ncbi:MAG: type IV secretion system protein [Alphaproteobacteria bacterium]|nr:type IV secretion system protein [Alphaproteobacteria bacterium]
MKKRYIQHILNQMSVKRVVSRSLVMLLPMTLLLLAACNKDHSDQCIYNWDYSNIDQSEKTVYSKNPSYRAGSDPRRAQPDWVKAGVKLKSGDDLIILPAGLINLCGGGTTTVGSGNDGFNAQNGHWYTVPGVKVNRGDIIDISALNSYSMWGNETDCTAESGRGSQRWNTGCQSFEGRGLLVQVANSADNTNDEDYAELFDYSINKPIGSYQAPKDGYLQIKHADQDHNVQARPDDLTGGDYSNNKDGYKVTIATGGCSFRNGEYLYGYIGQNHPDATYQFEQTPGIFEVGQQYGFDENNQARVHASSEGNLWLAIIDAKDHDYTNNKGSYTVTIASNGHENDNNFVVNVIDNLVDPVESTMHDVGKGIFNNLMGGPDLPLVKIVQSLLVLFVIFSCIGYMFGLISATQTDLLIRIIKISIVAALISPQSWHYFNQYLFKLFMDGMIAVIDHVFSIFSDTHTQVKHFAFMSDSLNLLFDQDTWNKLLGLLFAGPIGWVYLALFLLGIYFYIWAIIKAVIAYLMAIIGLTLLFIVSPLFFCFMLFQETKSLFDGWYKQMVTYSLTAIFVMSSVVIFHYWIYAILTKILGFGVCWKCVIPVKIPVISYTVCFFYYWLPEGFTNDHDISFYLSNDAVDNLSNMAASLPFIFFSLLMFIIVAYAMKKFVDFMVMVAHAVSGLATTSALGGSAATPTGSAFAPIKGIYTKGFDFTKDKTTGFVKRGLMGGTTNPANAEKKGSDSKKRPLSEAEKHSRYLAKNDQEGGENG